MFSLPRLAANEAITEKDLPTLVFHKWWQAVVMALTSAITTLQTAVTDIQNNSDSINGLSTDKQDASAVLTGLAALDGTSGLVEQTGTTSFTKHTIGVSPGNIPTVTNTDARYLRSDGSLTAAVIPSTHKLAVTIGGTPYYILLST